MAEPTSVVVTGAQAVGGATIVIAISGFLEAVGVPWPNVFWGFMGALLGLSIPKDVTRLRAAGMFVAASFLAALAGGWIAKTGVGGGMPANLVSGIVGFGIHFFASKAVKKLTGEDPAVAPPATPKEP